MTLLSWISWANRGKSRGREFSSRLPTGSLANSATREVWGLWTSFTGVWPAPRQDLPEAACCRKRLDAPQAGLLASGDHGRARLGSPLSRVWMWKVSACFHRWPQRIAIPSSKRDISINQKLAPLQESCPVLGTIRKQAFGQEPSSRGK